MASIIRIKRSAGTNKPASLQWGELGYVTGIGSFGGLNQYKDRVFLGDDGTNANPVGGYYYTSMMEHQPGAVSGVQNTRNQDGGVVPVMAPLPNTGLGGANSLKVDQWNVDNLRIDTNTISSTNTDGDIILDPNGSGEVLIPDDTFFTFGNDDDARIEYDEDGTNRVQVTGAPWTWNTGIAVTQESQFGDVRIENNIISTVAGSTDTLYIDPYPDGLSNEGTVIVKGNLQVDGTTTTLNSVESTTNDPIFHIGDTTSTRTVMQEVTSGDTSIVLDSIVGIHTGDVVAGTGIQVGSIVSSYNTGTNTIVIDTGTTAGISTTSQLTFTHSYDTNTDRGISFAYNTGSGAVNNKTGFFGYSDLSGDDSNAPERSWTYIPEASISYNVVSGTRGYLDIKGIYYQIGDYQTHGVVYFDDQGLQTSTNNPALPTLTSKQILTAITKNTLTVSPAVTINVGDIIRQDTTNAYGVVESVTNGGTTVDVVGVEGTFNTTNNLRREGQNGFISNLSSIPSNVASIYTNKPTWTSILDGGSF